MSDARLRKLSPLRVERPTSEHGHQQLKLKYHQYKSSCVEDAHRSTAVFTTQSVVIGRSTVNVQ